MADPINMNNGLFASTYSEQGHEINHEHIDPQTGLINPADLGEIKKSPEEKMYLIYYYAHNDEGEEYKSFEICIGRTETYKFIKTMAEYMDVYESKVLVEGLPLDESISVYTFCNHVKLYYDDGFDISDYAVGDYCEEENDRPIEPGTLNAEYMRLLRGISDTTEQDDSGEAFEDDDPNKYV